MRKILLLIFILFAAYTVNAQEKNSPKFSGLMFGDFFYNATSTTGDKDLNGFRFRRIYITTDYDVAEDISTRFRLEADQGSGSLTAGGKIGVMVKDAWLKWKNIFPGSDFFVGLSPTPAFDVSESAWGHRFLEKTILDLNGVVSSRDIGVDLKGKLTGSGSINYWVKIGNNSGNSPEANKYKRFYGLLQFKPAENFMFTIYGDYAAAAKVRDSFDETDKLHGSFVGALFLNYKQPESFSLGAEMFIAQTQHNYRVSPVSELESQSGFGFSVWAYANFSKNIQVVGRFDHVDPNADGNYNKDGRSLILGGIDFKVADNFTISPNIEAVTYQAGFPEGTDQSDVTPRVTFFWQF